MEFLLLCSALYNVVQRPNSGLAMQRLCNFRHKYNSLNLKCTTMSIMKLILPPVFTYEIKLMQVKKKNCKKCHIKVVGISSTP